MNLVAPSLAEIQPMPLRWIWPGWLATGSLHLLAGDSGTGKSTVAASLAAAISVGGLLPDGKTRAPRGSALLYSSEDSASAIKERLTISGADLASVRLIQDCTFQPASSLRALRDLVMQVGPTLVVLDPITVFCRSQSGPAVRSALEELADIARQSGAAILGITHFAKTAGQRRPDERVWGSFAYKAVPRLVMVTGVSAQSQETVLVRVKSNISKAGGGVEYKVVVLDAEQDGVVPTRIEWGEVVEGTPFDILETGKIVIADKPLQAAKAYLLDVLKLSALPASDVYEFAKAAGHARRTIERAKGELGVMSHYIGRTSHWRLPDTELDELADKPRRSTQ